MKIALIGYEAMGKLIESLAENKNHEIALTIDETDADGGNPKQLTDGVSNAAHPSLSSDGNWIY